jgi:two-component system cell cycle response regulator CtrA
LPRPIGKILIVELGGWSYASLPLWLASAGYEPEVVQGQEAAFTVLRHTSPVTLIVGGNGDAEFYSALRRASMVPILVLAPAANPEQIVAALGAGVDDLQPDSIDAGEIVARVNALVRRFR